MLRDKRRKFNTNVLHMNALLNYAFTDTESHANKNIINMSNIEELVNKFSHVKKSCNIRPVCNFNYVSKTSGANTGAACN